MRMRILFSLVFFLAVWNGPASAGNAPPSRTMKTEVLILQDRLNQALQEEAILRAPLLSLGDGGRFVPLRVPGDAPIGGYPGLMLKPLFEHLLGGPSGVFPIRNYLLRLLSVTVLMSILTLPLMAAQRMRADLRPKEIVRLFPILTFRETDGSRGMLRAVIKPKGA